MKQTALGDGRFRREAVATGRASERLLTNLIALKKSEVAEVGRR